MEYRESEGDGRALRAGAGAIAVLLSAGAAAADRIAPLTAGDVGYSSAQCAAWSPGARLLLYFESGQDVDTTVTVRAHSRGPTLRRRPAAGPRPVPRARRAWRW